MRQGAIGLRQIVIAALSVTAMLVLPRTGRADMGPTTAPAAAPVSAPPAPATQAASIHVAAVRCAKSRGEICFGEQFLAEAGRRAHLDVDRRLVTIDLASDDLFRYPFVVMTGEQAFELTDVESRNLKAFLQHGGFVLATAACSSPDWAKSFKAALTRTLAPDKPGGGAPASVGRTGSPRASTRPSGDANRAGAPRVPSEPSAGVKADRPLAWKKLPLVHPIFHQVFDIERLQSKQVPDEPLVIEGLEIDGRLSVVFSATGLNDTSQTPGPCCCCGRNEMQDAARINANILAYALLH